MLRWACFSLEIQFELQKLFSSIRLLLVWIIYKKDPKIPNMMVLSCFKLSDLKYMEKTAKNSEKTRFFAKKFNFWKKADESR